MNIGLTAGPAMSVRKFFAAAVASLAVLTVTSAARSSHAVEPRVADAPVTAVESIGMVVADMERALDFYTRVLPFEKVSETEVAGEEFERLTGVFGARARTVRLRLGDELLDLTDYLAPEGRPIPVDSRSNDRSFQHIAIVVSDMDRAYAHLRANKVQHASTGPQTLPAWNRDAGGIKAFYFKDPENHVLEVIWFPLGKGDPRWQQPTDRLFLGIDHTAIVVADTDASLSFYRDVLGMRIAGGAENYGTEQEHLNNVFGARLRITTLKAAKGPGVELLEYLSPRTGRAAPSDTLSNDVWSWQVRFSAPDAGYAAERLSSSHAALISPGLVEFRDASTGVQRAIAARDGDGHAVVIAQPSR